MGGGGREGEEEEEEDFMNTFSDSSFFGKNNLSPSEVGTNILAPRMNNIPALDRLGETMAVARRIFVLKMLLGLVVTCDNLPQI